MAKISVIVCTKNEEKHIEGCLKSLVSQEIRPEIIVVDGHSKDRTRIIAKKYADKILLDNGHGLSEARNIGWKAATSPIVAFCDADCRPKKEWTKNILKLMKPGVVGVSGPLNSYDGRFRTKMNIKIFADWYPRLVHFFGYSNVWGANMAFRKEILEKYPFRLKFLEDYDIGHRLRRSRCGKLKFDKSITMPMSARRFEKSFFRTCLRFYIKTLIMMKFFRNYDMEGYYFHQKQT